MGCISEKRGERTEGWEGPWACRVEEAAWGDWILFSTKKK